MSLSRLGLDPLDGTWSLSVRGEEVVSGTTAVRKGFDSEMAGKTGRV